MTSTHSADSVDVLRREVASLRRQLHETQRQLEQTATGTSVSRQAETDALTGLANRFGLARAFERMEQDGIWPAVIFLDLDGFKLINDTRGHEVGDEVLAEVARRIRRASTADSLAARFGGDEFVVVCFPDTLTAAETTSASQRRRAVDIAHAIKSALSTPISTITGPVVIGASIGVCDGTVPSRVPSAQLQRADTAMYEAKRLGKDRIFIYDEALHHQAVTYRRTESAVRNALAENRFTVHYQPIVDSVSTRMVGVEALVRLVDGTGELIAPGAFISVAERSGLIVPLGAWVLASSCRTIAQLRRDTGRPLYVSVNISSRQAARADLVAAVDQALDESGLPAEALSLELTESALLDAGEETLRRFRNLRARGIHIAIDDFGTGYSSLTYLRQLPLTHIKVDQSFVSGMTTTNDNAAIVEAVTWLAHKMNLQWVAEGVETRDQFDALREMGHGYLQGFLLSRPVPADQLAELVHRDRLLPREHTRRVTAPRG